MMHTVALSLAVLGVVAAWKSHSLKRPTPAPNLYSIHSWLVLIILTDFSELVMISRAGPRAQCKLDFFFAICWYFASCNVGKTCHLPTGSLDFGTGSLPSFPWRVSLFVPTRKLRCPSFILSVPCRSRWIRICFSNCNDAGWHTGMLHVQLCAHYLLYRRKPSNTLRYVVWLCDDGTLQDSGCASASRSVEVPGQACHLTFNKTRNRFRDQALKASRSSNTSQAH